ncbi:MAG: CPBP family glutamic-type intramembrane protease [Alphaproteobacteria bacterium]
MTSRVFLALEFIALCIALPTSIIVFRLAPYMFFFLWSAWAVCWSIYRHYHYAELKTLWRWRSVTWKNLRPILIRWAICSVLMFLFTWWYDPEKLFYIPRENPMLIPFLMVFYPIFSALPQEFIFCTFFFDRYKPFFPSNKVRVIASAIVFAYAHVLFINPVAPPLSLIAGLIFAGTFAKTRSLALVTIEHSLYGLVLFIVGLGWYFWAGALI